MTVLRVSLRLLQAGHPQNYFLLCAQKFRTPALKVILRITAKFRVQTQTHVCHYLRAVQLRQLACHACLV